VEVREGEELGKLAIFHSPLEKVRVLLAVLLAGVSSESKLTRERADR